ncbi:MAG: ABC transporter ATP-binding protein [Christensenellaceae bacterium]|jgi:ABC-2 type transport system ATP-binding protein
MITVENISKTFRVVKRSAGFGAAVKSFFRPSYSYIEALKEISFEIAEGEMVGYIGPNGAGKSSTIKIMSGILTPDSGRCIINGRVPWKERKAHVKEIGVVFGQRSQLWWDVPVEDSFSLLKDIYEVDEKVYRNNLAALSEQLQLQELLRTPTRQLSLGQRMRCEIAASLLHDPKILFLDEPTIGLDAVSKIAVREFIKTLNKEKKTTVILTTHDMQDIEALTERILLIGKGQILLDGTLRELKETYAQKKTLVVTYTAGEIPELPGVSVLENEKGSARLSVPAGEYTVSEIIQRLSEHIEMQDFSVVEPTAEEMVVSMYGAFEI